MSFAGQFRLTSCGQCSTFREGAVCNGSCNEVRDILLPDGTVRHNVGSDNLSDEDRAAMALTQGQVDALNAMSTTFYTWDGATVTASDLWERFIEHLNRVQPLKNGLPHKNFIGSIAAYRKIFIQSQEN